ncbi:MAG: 50S ribosomal protein L31 [Armatimonadetes bacterium]|nr:50S ribosomal protein L31 [Armatimonadota bacterium]
MKKGIHPTVQTVTVTCGCGNTFQTLSVRDEVRVEICAACHPVFRGEGGMRIVDTEGRVEKFMKKYQNFGQAKK